MAKKTDQNFQFDWADLAFSSKKEIKELEATFIAAPREISTKRFVQLVKQYLPGGNIVVGVAKEEYVEGFDGQPQFKTLRQPAIQPVIDQVSSSHTAKKIYILQYFQHEFSDLLDKLNFKKVVLVNGSWKYSFHTSSAYYKLVSLGMKFEYVSPFTDEAEAKAYDIKLAKALSSMAPASPATNYTAADMLELAEKAARLSFDYNFQTGAALGKKSPKGGYKFLLSSFNKVVPYQTFAMHHGASREVHLSPPHDLNHYDTVHAEVMMILKAYAEKINLAGTTLFVNLMPCPPCARMLSQTGIAGIIYKHDHSDGYSVKFLSKVRKKVERLIQ